MLEWHGVMPFCPVAQGDPGTESPIVMDKRLALGQFQRKCAIRSIELDSQGGDEPEGADDRKKPPVDKRQSRLWKADHGRPLSGNPNVAESINHPLFGWKKGQST